MKHVVLQIPFADGLLLSAAVAECVVEDDRDATSTAFEAETESNDVAAYSANDPVMPPLPIVSSRGENEMENLYKIILLFITTFCMLNFYTFVFL